MINLTKKVMDFILQIRENGGKITKSEQNMFDSVRYYFIVNYLFSNGILTCNGVNENNQKVWCFTDKGRKIADYIFKIKEVYYGSEKKGKGNSS